MARDEQAIEGENSIGEDEKKVENGEEITGKRFEVRSYQMLRQAPLLLLLPISQSLLPLMLSISPSPLPFSTSSLPTLACRPWSMLWSNSIEFPSKNIIKWIGGFEFCQLYDANLQSYGYGYRFDEEFNHIGHMCKQKGLDVLDFQREKRHMDEVEDTCQYPWKKIHQVEDVLDFIEGIEYSTWFSIKVEGINKEIMLCKDSGALNNFNLKELVSKMNQPTRVMGRYGLNGKTGVTVIIKGISRDVRISRDVSPYLQDVRAVQGFLPIELVTADLISGVQLLQNGDATDINRKIRSVKIEVSSQYVLLMHTFNFWLNPVTLPINQKFWLADVYRKFRLLISYYSVSKSSSYILEFRHTLTEIETVGEPPTWSLPPPLSFDFHLPCLMVEARAAWFHFPLFGNGRTGEAKKRKTSFFLPTIKKQKTAEVWRLTCKKMQSQTKRVLDIVPFEFIPGHFSINFHCGLYMEAVEEKSCIMLDFSKQVKLLKFKLDNIGTKRIRFEGLWLGIVIGEPLPQPLRPPFSTVTNGMWLQRHFHFFPP